MLHTGDLAEFWEGPWPSLHGQGHLDTPNPPPANVISQNREVMSQGAPENPFPFVKGAPALGLLASSLSDVGQSGTFMTLVLGETARKLGVNIGACQQPVTATA